MKTITSKQIVFLIAVLNVLLFISYADTLRQLFDFWSESYGYSHGVLLFPLALGIYFYELYKTPKLSLAYLNAYSVFSLLLLILIWFVADILSIQVIEFVSFFLILFLLNLVLTSTSLKNINHLWPLLLILFTLPVWDFLSEILRLIETPIVVLALKASFIHTVQDGFLIYVPAGTFLVETSCSGFNQFIVSIPLGALYLYSRNLTLAKGYRIILILLLLAMFFNVLRIYIIVVAGQLTHMKTALLDDHEYLAWLIYGIGVFAFFYWSDKKIAQNENHPEADKGDKQMSRSNNTKLKKPVLLLVSILLTGPIISFAYLSYKDNSLFNVQHLEENLFWKDTSQPVKFVPDYDDGDLVYSKNLSNLLGQTVNLYINYFTKQEQGHEAINGINSLVKEDKGRVGQYRRHKVELSLTDSIQVNESVVSYNSGEAYIVWQWYFTNGQHITSSGNARYNHLKAVIANRPQISNIVISQKLTTSEQQSRHVLKRFLADNLLVLTRSLSIPSASAAGSSLD